MQPVVRRLVSLEFGDAERDRHRRAGHEFIGVHEGAQLLGEVRGVVQVGALEHHDEFLAADAVQAVGDPNAKVDDVGDAFQYAVARGMPVYVIDALEMVKIE